MRWWIVAVLISGSCLTSGQAVSGQVRGGGDLDGTQITALRAEWVRNLHDKNVAAWVGQFSADAVFVNPDGGREVGTDALTKFCQMITKTFDSDLVFTSRHTESSGDLAYDSGTYTEALVLRASQKKQSASGSYLTIYRRVDGRHWLIAEQVWTGAISDAKQ